MEITRDTVHQWLKKERRSQTWLAEKCGVTVQAVSNWLRENNFQPISAAAQITIRALMEEDAAASQATPPHSLVLEFDDEDYAVIEQAALQKPETVREWAKRTLNEAADADMREIAATLGNAKPSPRILPSPPSNLIQLPFYGTVAAGMPGGPLDTADGTHPVPGSYDPATHYVLRVNGQSMEPDYPDGSHVVCRKLRDGEFAKKGQDVISHDASGAYFKRLVYQKDGKKGDAPRKAVPRLVSINPEFPEVLPVSDCPIVAVVAGKV